LALVPSGFSFHESNTDMRLAAQKRGGFYPGAPETIAHAATFLRPPEDEPFAILDPCAGEGAAIQQLGDLLLSEGTDVRH